ncbi:MAG TPA: hypothetical protein VK504_03990, partial [Vicinamibacterales bacterium]|nr:hypothetical protein [Vicinamibacterales bacterium]
MPDGNLGPWRNNTNSVKWGGKYNGDIKEDDPTLAALPDTWQVALCEWLIPIIGGDGTVIEIGNEMPEKELHQRTAALIRQIISPRQEVSWNRNEDTPGQYANMMKRANEYQRCAYHGRLLKRVSDLDRVYPREPDYPTFRAFFDDCPHEPARIIFSSDGARSSDDPIDTYDWPNLLAFATEVLRRGCSYEHQSRMKMPENRYDFSKVEHDFLRDLAKA